MLASLLRRLMTPRPLTRANRRLAYGVAIATDVLQFLLGPIGWVGVDEGLDVLAAVAIHRLLGFHPLLLPTFLIEFLPVSDMLPTWTACVALVVRNRPLVADDPPPPGPGQVIDI